MVGLITRANLVDIVYDSIWGEGAEEAQYEAERNEAEQSKQQEKTSAETTVNENNASHDDTSDSGVER